MNNEDIHGPVPEDTRAGSGLPMPRGKQAFQNITRELSDDDLTNPAVMRRVAKRLPKRAGTVRR